MGVLEEERQIGRPKNRRGNNIEMELRLHGRGRGLDSFGSE
jgi:hypothetical protein